jgi:hypothetical protein
MEEPSNNADGVITGNNEYQTHFCNGDVLIDGSEQYDLLDYANRTVNYFAGYLPPTDNGHGGERHLVRGDVLDRSKKSTYQIL